MFRRLSIIVPFVLATGLLAADLPEKWSKRLESADANYQSAVQKADNVRFYAVQKASQERIKLLKTALADATKAGDFDAATEIKARVAAAETAGGIKSKPKNVVKFGGHEYALIEEKLTWHLAKRACEEMGGHLVCLETAPEVDFVLRLAGSTTAWIGATDEVTEGDWRWVTGPKVTLQLALDNANDADHWVALFEGKFHDGTGGNRWSYICEWE